LAAGGAAAVAAPPSAGAGAGTAMAAASIEPVSVISNSAATRRVRLLNSMPLRNPISLAASIASTLRSSSVVGTGAARSSVTSRFEMRAFSAFAIRFSRRLGCLISPARASSDSRSPNAVISSAAVFTPIPGTPGTLSTESPASACTSTTLSGVTPNFSITSAGPIRFDFMAS